MKFWQLVSVCRELNLPLESLELGEDGDILKSWYADYSTIVQNQDRSILDHEIPDTLCESIIAHSDAEYYFSEGYLRKQKLTDRDQRMSVSDIVHKFGGGKLEEMMEYGLVQV